MIDTSLAIGLMVISFLFGCFIVRPYWISDEGVTRLYMALDRLERMLDEWDGEYDNDTALHRAMHEGQEDVDEGQNNQGSHT